VTHSGRTAEPQLSLKELVLTRYITDSTYPGNYQISLVDGIQNAALQQLDMAAFFVHNSCFGRYLEGIVEGYANS
jgi:hypothetical protein